MEKPTEIDLSNFTPENVIESWEKAVQSPCAFNKGLKKMLRDEKADRLDFELYIEKWAYSELGKLLTPPVNKLLTAQELKAQGVSLHSEILPDNHLRYWFMQHNKQVGIDFIYRFRIDIGNRVS